MKNFDPNEYKYLCEKANKIIQEVKENYIGEGWVKVTNSPKYRSNFKAVLYEKDGQYALCFVGTDKWSYKDHGANLKMATTGDSQQIQDAKKYTDKLIDEYNLTPENTVSIGHSEGGTEATQVGLKNKFKTITFNAYGVSKKTLPTNADYSLVTNYRDPHDPVSKLHANVGKTYITPSTQTGFMSKTPFGSIKSHGISQMGDCNKAVPVEEYKKSHPLFLDKISDKNISRKDIKNMDGNLFQVYEKEIDKRVSNNEIQSGDEKWVTINGNHVLINN